MTGVGLMHFFLCMPVPLIINILFSENKNRGSWPYFNETTGNYVPTDDKSIFFY
jgi:hypothetical protein